MKGRQGEEVEGDKEVVEGDREGKKNTLRGGAEVGRDREEGERNEGKRRKWRGGGGVGE